MPPLTVPYLAAHRIEQTASELLRAFSRWLGAEVTPPIDVDRMVEGYLGLELAVVDLSEIFGQSGVLGATFFDLGRVFIDQSLERHPGRFAFTLAHEIGHYQLHRPLVEMDRVSLPASLRDGPTQLSRAVVCRTTDRHARAEWQADRFAASLLMPVQVVIATARQVFGAQLPVCRGQRGKPIRIDARLRRAANEVKAAGGFSNVSNDAMAYRLLDLELVRVRSHLQGFVV